MSINLKNDSINFYNYNPYQIKVNRKTFNPYYNMHKFNLENITKLSPPSEKNDEFRQNNNFNKYKYYKQKYLQQNPKPLLTEGNFHEKHNSSLYSRYLSSDRSRLEKGIHKCPSETYSITEGYQHQNNITKNSDTNSIRRLKYRLVSKRTNSIKSNDFSNSVNLSENDVFYYNELKKEENLHNIIGSSTNLFVTQSQTQYPYQNLTNKICNTHQNSSKKSCSKTDSESKNNKSNSKKNNNKDEIGNYKISNPGKGRLFTNYNNKKIRLNKIDQKFDIWREGNMIMKSNNIGKYTKNIYNKKNNYFSLDNKFKNKDQYNCSNSCKDFYKKKEIDQINENKYNAKYEDHLYKNINTNNNINSNSNYYINCEYYNRNPPSLNVIKRNNNSNKNNSISKTNTIIINNNITKNIQNFKYWNNSSKNIYSYNPFEKFGEYGCQLIGKFCDFFEEIIYFRLKSYLKFFFYQIQNYLKNKRCKAKTLKKNEIKKSLYGFKKTPIHFKDLRSNILDSVINSENYYTTFNNIFRKPGIENNSDNHCRYVKCLLNNEGNNKIKKNLSMNINNNNHFDYYFKNNDNDNINNFYSKIYFPRKRLSQNKSEKSYISMDEANNIIMPKNDNNIRKIAKVNSLKKKIDYIGKNLSAQKDINLRFKNVRNKYKKINNFNLIDISNENDNISKNTQDPKKFKTSNNSPENLYIYNTRTNIHNSKMKKNNILKKPEKEKTKEMSSIYHKKVQNQKTVNNIYSKPLLKKLQNKCNDIENSNNKSSKKIKNNNDLSLIAPLLKNSANKKKIYVNKNLAITESAKINIEKSNIKKIQKLKCYIVKDACSKDKKLNVFIKYYFNNNLFNDKKTNINNNFVIESLRPISLIPISRKSVIANKKTNKFLQDILTSIIEEDEKSKANRSLNNSIISEDEKQLQNIKNIINNNFMKNVIIYLVGSLQNIFDSNRKLILFAFIKNLKKINYNLYLHKTLEQFNVNNNNTNNCNNKNKASLNCYQTEKKTKKCFKIDKCHTPKYIEYPNQLKDSYDFSNCKSYERVSSFSGKYKGKNELEKLDVKSKKI